MLREFSERRFIYSCRGIQRKLQTFDLGLDEGSRAGGKRQISSPWGKALWCVKVREGHAILLVNYSTCNSAINTEVRTPVWLALEALDCE